MDLTALQLAARFSLPPNSLGYCGKNTAPARFIDCVSNKNCDYVEEELKKLTILNTYIQTLAHISGLTPYSYKVVEAYWLGNELLKEAKQKDFAVLLNNFSKQGVPDWIVTNLKKKSQIKFIPFHLSQVLNIRIDGVNKPLSEDLNNINNCMIRWGKVSKIDTHNLEAELHSLYIKESQLFLKTSCETVSYLPDLLPHVRTGDSIAVHWNQAIKILTPNEITNLSLWTKKTISLL